jgi:hypothetical protein
MSQKENRMKNMTQILCLLLCLWGTSALAWDRPAMAKYGAVYTGQEFLRVDVAHNQADDHAILKISGINHKLDGQMFWAEVRYQAGHPERVVYVFSESDGERPEFYVDNGVGRLMIPNWRGQARVELKLYYDHKLSAETPPEQLATDYENQLKQK